MLAIATCMARPCSCIDTRMHFKRKRGNPKFPSHPFHRWTGGGRAHAFRDNAKSLFLPGRLNAQAAGELAMATTTAGSSGLWQLSRAGCNKLGSPLPHQGPCPLAQRDAERAQVAKAELGQIPAVGLDKWLLHHMPGKPCHFQCHLLCNALVVLATQDCPRARHEATTKVGADSLCNQCSRDLLLQRGLAAHNRLLFFWGGARTFGETCSGSSCRRSRAQTTSKTKSMPSLWISKPGTETQQKKR